MPSRAAASSTAQVQKSKEQIEHEESERDRQRRQQSINDEQELERLAKSLGEGAVSVLRKKIAEKRQQEWAGR